VFCDGSPTARLVVYGSSASDERFSGLSGEFGTISEGATHESPRPDGFIPAFGIALCGMSTAVVDINLMPVNLRKKPDKTAYYIMATLAALLILAGGIWTGSHFLSQRRIVTTLDTELTRLRAEVSEIEEIQNQTLEMQKNLEFIRSLRPGNIFAMEILNELSTIIPSSAWLTDLKLTGDKLHLYGVAASATELISLLEASPLFESVEFVSTIRKDRDGMEIFRIGCTLQAGKQEG
jgi:general secretion pathway protein L